MGEYLKELRITGEDKAIKAIQEVIGDLCTGGLLGINDDASAINVMDTLLIKIDGTSESASRYPWMGLDDLSYRVLASASTDIIAKGGRPEYALISLGIPPSRTLKDLISLAKGVKEFLSKYGMKLLGGDLNASTNDIGIWIDAVVLGRVRGRLISIKGVEDGDLLCLTGCIGRSAIPAIINYVLRDSSRLSNELMESIRRPEIPLNFLKFTNLVKAATDISDGLRSISRLLKLNNVTLTIYEDLPLCEDVVEFIEKHSISKDLILRFLGEEYVIAYTRRDGRCPKGLALGMLAKGRPEIVFRGERVRWGWDNFRGYSQS